MKMLACESESTIRRLVGQLDTRSAPGSCTPGDFTIALNWPLDDATQRRRLPGWRKLTWAEGDPYGNQDLHDQLLSYYLPATPPPKREPITSIFEASGATDTRSRRVIAATHSRVYVSTNTARNWRMIGNNFASATTGEWATRFSIAQLGGYVMMANGVDPVQAWLFDSADSLMPVQDLLDFDIDTAAVVASWNGFIFLGDVTVNGTRQPNAIYWSDFNNPLQFGPGGESLAGFTLLPDGEEVLAILPLGGQMRVYTTKAIYRVIAVPDESIVFNFPEHYRGPDVPAFKYAIVDTGQEHVYLTDNSLVALRAYDAMPRRDEWMHKASGCIFKGLDGRLLQGYPGEFTAFPPLAQVDCDKVTGVFDAERKVVWFSWPTGGRWMSLVLNYAYTTSTLVDAGVSAGCMHSPDEAPTLRDFLIHYNICPPTADAVAPEPGEGCPHFPPPVVPVPPASVDELCVLVGDLTVTQLCEGCSREPRFVMASPEDNTLKEVDDDFYSREWHDSTQPPVSEPLGCQVGVYYSEGYESILQPDASFLGTTNEKLFVGVNVGFDQVDQSTPSWLHCALGSGKLHGCLTFTPGTPKEIACVQVPEDVRPVPGGTARPELTPAFPFYQRGAVATWRLYVSVPLPQAPADYSPTGAVVTTQEVVLRWRPIEASWRKA